MDLVNDPSDILYTPNDNRTETNVQDELDRINTELSDKVDTDNIAVRLINISSTGTYYNADLPEGWDVNDLIIIGAQYHNSNNGLWYNINSSDFAVAFTIVNNIYKIGAFVTVSGVDKVKVAVYKYR